MKVSKRVATHGLNVSMSVFVGFSVYGFLQYSDWGGGGTPGSGLSLPVSVAIAVLIASSIAGMVFFGHQLDLRNLAIYREEEARKATDAAKQGRRKPVKGE
jgi:carbohydrate-binding DOMON domain-containing protein